MFDHDYHVKIIDFATSMTNNQQLSAKIPKGPNRKAPYMQENNDTDRCNSLMIGTEEYVAPEILKGGEGTYASDLWSLGIMIYQWIVGHTPFKG